MGGQGPHVFLAGSNGGANAVADCRAQCVRSLTNHAAGGGVEGGWRSAGGIMVSTAGEYRPGA